MNVKKKDLFYSKANKTNWGNEGKRGGFEYKPPHGWIGIGLKVLGKYDNGNDDWLGNDGNKNEWAVAYRIVSGEYIKNILSDGFLVGMMNFFRIMMISIIQVKRLEEVLSFFIIQNK